jgi:hypothetical protein
MTPIRPRSPFPKYILALAVLGLLCRFDAIAGTPPMAQSRASYEAAFATMSTSPAYVLVNIADGDTAQPTPVCTTANFLLGAIHFEYGLGYDHDGALEAKAIALVHQDHVFRFQRQAALNNIPRRYTEGDLDAARSLLAPLSDDTVKAKFSSLYAKDRLPMDAYSRDAIACALIERGFSPWQADRSAQVYLKFSPPAAPTP